MSGDAEQRSLCRLHIPAPPLVSVPGNLSARKFLTSGTQVATWRDIHGHAGESRVLSPQPWPEGRCGDMRASFAA